MAAILAIVVAVTVGEQRHAFKSFKRGDQGAKLPGFREWVAATG